jgi:hypothetical protein
MNSCEVDRLTGKHIYSLDLDRKVRIYPTLAILVPQAQLTPCSWFHILYLKVLRETTYANNPYMPK